MTSRNYCFTSFNMGWNCQAERKGIKYMICQLETTQDDRLHYQGYAEFTDKIRRKQAKELLGDDTMHLEPRRGTREQAIAYCKKKESQMDGPWEQGDINNTQGHRSDIEAVANDLKKGHNLNTLAEQHTAQMIKYHNGILKTKALLQKPRNEKTELHIYWGDSGTGKTRTAFEENKDSYFKPNGQWWDGYENNECVILDDYDGYINFREFLQLTDRYPHKVPIKGGFAEFNSKKIIITSNIDPNTWYFNERMNTVNNEAFKRRVTNIKHFTKADQP